MASTTTLVTFLLNSIPTCHSVQLLGSWDNFSVSYPMQKDRQKGHGHWVGCHYFKNIVCDGDPSQPVEHRDGGLKPGGTYWYYYKLNGDIEYHDPSRPSTNACPLLPGQTVNVLELPVDQLSLPGADLDSIETEKLLTRDPNARYVKPVPPKKRKRLDAPQHSPPDQQSLSKLHKDWLTNSTGRLQTALVDKVIHAFGTPRQNNPGLLQASRKLRTAPATMPNLALEYDNNDRNLLSRMDSWRSSAHRPHARRGPPTKDGTISRTTSTKSISHTENPFNPFSQRRQDSVLSNRVYLETIKNQVEEPAADLHRPTTWNETTASKSLTLTLETPDDYSEPVRPFSAPPDCPEFIDDTRSLDVATDWDAPLLEEAPSVGRLSAIMEVEAETSFGPDGEVQRTAWGTPLPDENVGSPERKAHPPDENTSSPEAMAEMKRGDSKRSLRARSSAMFSRRTSKKSSSRPSRSSSLTESIRSLDYTTSSSQADDASLWTSVRSSTSSISAGWASPYLAANAGPIESGRAMATHLGSGNSSDKKLGLAETRLGIGESRILPAALDSQETIKPIELKNGSSPGNDMEFIRNKEQERTFTKLTEHVELALESGRFERRFSFSNEPEMYPKYAINSADFHHNTFSEEEEEEAEEHPNGDFQIHQPHDDMLNELSYLGSLIA